MKNKFKAVTGIELFRLLIRKIGLIALTCLSVGVAAAVATFFIDEEFKSQANLLPAEQRSIGLDLIGGGGIGSLASGLLGGRTRVFDRYYVLLNSDTVKRRVIEQFNLINHYDLAGAKFPTIEAMLALEGKTRFRGLQEGNFIIEVWDKDPVLAKNICDYYIQILNELNTELLVTDARNFREFIETRYFESVNKLDEIRNDYAEFLRKYGVIELTAQAESNAGIIGELISEKIKAEAQLEIALRSFGANSSTYRQLKTQVEVYEAKIQALFHNRNKEPLILPLNEFPQIAVEYGVLLQNIEIEIQIQKFVLPLYEQAKLEENKALPLVNVVDNPRVAEKKDKPFRALIVLVSMLSAFLIVLVWMCLQLMWQKNDLFIKELIYDKPDAGQV